jgi:hypothetical protein
LHCSASHLAHVPALEPAIYDSCPHQSPCFCHFGPDFDFFLFSSRLLPLSHRLLCFKLLFSRFGFLRAWLTRESRVSLFWLGFFDGGFWLDLEFMDFFFSFKDFCVFRDS